MVQVSFFVDDARRAPAELLESWHTLAQVAAAATRGGARVTVVQACLREQVLVRDGVSFHFVSPEGRNPLTRSLRFAALLDELRPDVLHVHGLHFARELLGLRELAPHTPILVQDHADRLPRLWRRRHCRRGLAQANAVAFCCREQADVFVRGKVLDETARVFEIPEASSTFTPGSLEAARAATGVSGNPAVLWVGHLDPNKDPLCVLEGLARAGRELPDLKAWFCYGRTPLLDEVRRRTAADDRLRDRVHLLGHVPHTHVQELMRAADLFVLGSHREGCNYSVIEALATGLAPVVTRIPSMRMLTADGAVGALWSAGDPDALSEALVRVAAGGRASRSEQVRRHFETHLSQAALGRRLAEVYGCLHGERLHGAA